MLFCKSNCDSIIYSSDLWMPVNSLYQSEPLSLLHFWNRCVNQPGNSAFIYSESNILIKAFPFEESSSLLIWKLENSGFLWELVIISWMSLLASSQSNDSAQVHFQHVIQSSLPNPIEGSDSGTVVVWGGERENNFLILF